MSSVETLTEMLYCKHWKQSWLGIFSELLSILKIIENLHKAGKSEGQSIYNSSMWAYSELNISVWGWKFIRLETFIKRFKIVLILTCTKWNNSLIPDKVSILVYEPTRVEGERILEVPGILHDEGQVSNNNTVLKLNICSWKLAFALFFSFD